MHRERIQPGRRDTRSLSLIHISEPTRLGQARLPATAKNPQQVRELEIAVGRTEKLDGKEHRWYRLTGTKVSGDTYRLWFLADRNPFDSEKRKGISIARYILQQGNEQPLEYVEKRTGRALLPLYRFVDQLLPTGKVTAGGLFLEKGHYLGHPIEKVATARIRPIGPPGDAKLLVLDTEMRIGKNTNYPQGKGTYTPDPPFVAADYDAMIEAGMNQFCVSPQQEKYVYNKPVFFYDYSRFWRRAGTIRYPETLYRANFCGMSMFVDEPASLLTGGKLGRRPYSPDDTLKERVRKLQDFVLVQRSGLSYGGQQDRYDGLRKKLREQGLDLGSLNLLHPDLPIWEFVVDTAWYQFEVHPHGMISETVAYSTPKHTALDQIASLRGAARAFNTKWGVGIYGWLLPSHRPVLLKAAYDAGATYFWFWTGTDAKDEISHKGQLELVKELLEHAKAHPRGDMKALLHKARTAIVLPYGYCMGMYRYRFKKNVNEAGVPYAKVIEAARRETQKCLKEEIPYDLAIAGKQFTGQGYEKIIWVKEDGSVSVERRALNLEEK